MLSLFCKAWCCYNAALSIHNLGGLCQELWEHSHPQSITLPLVVLSAALFWST